MRVPGLLGDAGSAAVAQALGYSSSQVRWGLLVQAEFQWDLLSFYLVLAMMAVSAIAKGFGLTLLLWGWEQGRNGMDRSLVEVEVWCEDCS